MAKAVDRVLHDFTSGSAKDGFEVINDTVMGGGSNSKLQLGSSDGAVFTGDVVTTGGGFVHFRSQPREWACDGATGLSVTCCSDDDREWKVTVRTNDSWDSYSYQARCC